MGHDDVEPLDARRELRDLGQLVIQVLAEAVRDLDVPSGDDDLHRCPPWGFGRCAWSACLRASRTAAPPPIREEQTPRDGPSCGSATSGMRRPRGGLGVPCMNASPSPGVATLQSSPGLSPDVRYAEGARDGPFLGPGAASL